MWKKAKIAVPDDIFLEYDVRGIAHENLTVEIVYKIGQAFGTVTNIKERDEVVIGRDARLSSPEFEEALVEGVRSTGCGVVKVGVVATPILYFATDYFATGTGLMITASHNAAEYNGIKMLLANHTLHGRNIQRLKQRIIDEDFVRGEGSVRSFDVQREYYHAVTCSTQLEEPVRVVIDCANGVAGEFAPVILRNIGCEVFELYCDVDGRFPNHSADPTVPENLKDLIAMVKEKKADVGLALDGDGDRLVAVSPSGEIIWPDRLMILFVREILAKHPGRNVVFDVKCSNLLQEEIKNAGGVPVMSKTGHALIRSKLMACDAIFGGEMSGHIYFRDRWTGFDDGIYAAARLCEYIAEKTESSQEIFDSLPQSVNTPEIRISCLNPHAMVEAISENVEFEGATINRIDGVRADFEDGFGLIRASNTAPEIVLRFESDTIEGLNRIQELFYNKISTQDWKID